jgi:hypothetical protein
LALRSFEQGGIFIIPYLLRHGVSGFFFGVIRRTVLFSPPLTTHERCGGPTLTRIFMDDYTFSTPEYVYCLLLCVVNWYVFVYRYVLTAYF